MHLKSKLVKFYNGKYLKQKSELLLVYLEAQIPFEIANKDLKLKCESLHDFLHRCSPDFFDNLKDDISLIDILYIQVYQEKLKKDFNKQFLSLTLYPLVLYFVYVAMNLFYKFVFSKEIETMLIQMGGNISQFNKLKTINTLHCIGLIVTLIFFLMMLFVYKHKDLMTIFIIKLNRILSQNVIRTLMSYKFIQYFNLFYRKGVDTKHTLTLLRAKSFDSSLRWLAYHMEHSFQKGEAWHCVYLDQSLQLFLMNASSKDLVMQGFDAYLNFSKEKLSLSFKRYNMLFKTFVFFLLAQTIFIYYQSLYLPLTILEAL